MGRLLTITATNQQRTGFRKRTLTRSAVAVGPISIQLVLIIVGTLLGVFYLIQSNRVSTQNLQLRALDQKKSQIAEDNERLSVEAARLQSLQQIKKQAADAKLQESGKAAAYLPAQSTN